jgi:hypothetical protein
MGKVKAYDNFPLWIVFASNLLSFSIYAIGTYIFLRIGIVFAIFYIIYVAWSELNVLRRSCRNCWYYGKTCGFGKGKACSMIFKKGNPKEFANRKISPLDVLPDFLTFIFPIIGGIALWIASFEWVIIGMIAALVILPVAGNFTVRGFLTCKYCKQRAIGCPAERMFSGRK